MLTFYNVFVFLQVDFLLPGRIRFRTETDAESDSINNVFGMRILIAVLIIKKSN